eukprot:466759_1
MFAGPRKSITQLFTGTVERELIGKEISHPTKAIATRAWAADQKTMDIGGNFDDDDIASNRNVEALQTELRHTHMSLLAERSRVQELESQLKSLMEKKYSSQSNIIDNLRSAQDKLREQLHLVIQSKMDLCESTALEIERLRIIIAELSQHLNGKINIEAIMNKYKVTMNNNNNKYKQEEKEEKKYNNNNANEFKCLISNNSNYKNICSIKDNINDAYCVVCDTYYHLTIAFEMYLEWMNILPLSIERLPIYVYLHSNISNAKYSYKGNNSIMLFSDGDKYNTFPWISIDIIAHEIAHGFTDKGAKFLKYGESFGIEEAYSDLIGECTEYYLNGNNDWKFGADIMKSLESNAALRRFDNNNELINYKLNILNERDWSAIYMKAFYLLNTKHMWTMEQLFKVMSYTNLYYWNSDNTLNEGLCAIYEVIYDLYGDNKAWADTMKLQLFNAFNEVGIQCVVFDMYGYDIMDIKMDIEYYVSGNIGERIYYYFKIDNNMEFTVGKQWYIMVSLMDVNGNGDSDLYVRYNGYECISNNIGNNEECKIYINVLNDCIYYVMIYGFDIFENVKLKWNIYMENDFEF